MGLDIHIHVGAYAVIKAEPIVEQDNILVCSNLECSNGKVQKGKFCTDCGMMLSERTLGRLTRASLYDLLPEDKYCDDLTWAAGEDNLDVILATGNHSDDGTDVGYINAEYGATIKEITADMPARFIAAFNTEYADVLAVLRERATSVEVKFGVLTWWS